ncbi:MAG TPA: hypothetical protein PKI20_19755 [Verrucomicrobiota bacterium]|jgi:Tfp pilus assembly protein PilO|nr:hypothetical protein [Verrucomicrobiota bacterium]HQL80032.1 hypothetical protein [Verrucomicrobiota bacterium]
MNLRKLPKEKRNQLVLVGLVTLMAITGLYFALIRHQNDKLARLKQQKTAAAQKLQLVRETIQRAKPIQADLDEVKKALTAAESDVASGDLYAWVINSLNKFKASYPAVNIPQFSQLGQASDVNLFPNFPYKQASLTIAGTAHFHDLGRFIADFENQNPHVRLLNLTLDFKGASPLAGEEELSFKMDIVTLVKVNPS